MRVFFSFSLQVLDSLHPLILQDRVRDVEQRRREERHGLGPGAGRRSGRVRPDLQLPGPPPLLTLRTLFKICLPELSNRTFALTHRLLYWTQFVCILKYKLPRGTVC